VTQASPEYLGIGAAAELLSVDPDTVRRWFDSGSLTGYRTPGGQRRVRRSDIEALLDAGAEVAS